MKKIFLLFIVLLFAIFSCKDKDLISGPGVNQQINFIDLPKDPAWGDTTIVYTEVRIVSTSGNSIQINEQFNGGPFGSFSISATLEIEAGTIPASDTIICMLTVRTENASVQISPIKNYFAHPLKLNIKYTGIDLQNVNMNTLTFVFSNDTGETVGGEYDYLTADASTGTLEIKDALIQYSPILESGCVCGFVSDVE